MILYNKKVRKAQEGIKTLEQAKTAAQNGGRNNKDNYRFDILSGGYTYMGDDYVKPKYMGGAGALSLVGPGILNGVSRISSLVRGRTAIQSGMKALPSAARKALPEGINKIPAIYKPPMPGGPSKPGIGKYLGVLAGGLGTMFGIKYLDSKIPGDSSEGTVSTDSTRDSANVTSKVVKPVDTTKAKAEIPGLVIKGADKTIITPKKGDKTKSTPKKGDKVSAEKKESPKNAIIRIQTRMNTRRKSRGEKLLDTDGIWGKNTQAEYDATIKEQQGLKDAGYKLKVDGIWGDESQAEFDKSAKYKEEYKKAGEDLKKIEDMDEELKNRPFEKGGILYKSL